MSDAAQGPDWWQASDGKWYPPDQHPDSQPAAPPPAAGATPPSPGGAAGAAGWSPGQSPWGELADWPLRAQSFLVDYIGPALVVGLLFGVSVPLWSILTLVVLGWGIYNGYLNGETGQSYGKKWVGTKVVGAETGQIIGGGQGVLRFISHILDSIICYIGYLFPLWDEKRQCIADKVIKTVVVKV